MRITFQTKEESKQQQLADFLKLTPSERVVNFIRLMERLKDFPSTKKENNNNFIVKINA